jgi:hypothetical protein
LQVFLLVESSLIYGQAGVGHCKSPESTFGFAEKIGVRATFLQLVYEGNQQDRWVGWWLKQNFRPSPKYY